MLSNIIVVGAAMCHPEHPSGLRHSFPLAASTVIYWWRTTVFLSTGKRAASLKGQPHLIIAGWRTAKAQFPSSMETTLEHFVELAKASLATITAQSLSVQSSFPHSFADAIPESTPRCNLHSESFSRGPGLQQLLWWPCWLSRIISIVQARLLAYLVHWLNSPKMALI